MKLKTLFSLILVLALGAVANITGTLSLVNYKGAGLQEVVYKGTSYPVANDGSFRIQTIDPASINVNLNSTHKVLTGAYDVFGRKLNHPQSWASQIASIKQYSTAQNVSARSQYSSSDTLFVLVNGDTIHRVSILNENVDSLHIVKICVTDTSDSVAIFDSTKFLRLERLTDSVAKYPHGRTVFQIGSISPLSSLLNYDSANTGNSVNTWMYTDTLQGVVAKDDSSLTLKDSSSTGWVKANTWTNLKAGNTFKYGKIKYDPSNVQTLDNANVDKLQLTIIYRKVSVTWKNP